MTTIYEANRIARQLDAAMNAAGDRACPMPPPEVVHLVPVVGESHGVPTRCCGVREQHVPSGHSLTIDPSKVTCGGTA